VSIPVSRCCVGLISFVASTANSKQSSCDESRSLSSNCSTSAKRRQLHSFVTTFNTHLPAKLCSCLVSVWPRLNLIINHRRRSGPRGSVAQCVFLLSCLILFCSAATSTLTGMGTCWQSDKNATTDPMTSHQHDIGVAPIDALHAISDETSKADTHPSQGNRRSLRRFIHREQWQTFEFGAGTRIAYRLTSSRVFFFSLFACLFTSKIPHSLHLSAYFIFCRSCPSDRPCLFCISYPRIHVASHPRSLLAATASLHQSCKSVSLAPLPYDLTPLPRFNYSTRSSFSYTDQPHLSSRPWTPPALVSILRLSIGLDSERTNGSIRPSRPVIHAPRLHTCISPANCRS